MKSFVIILGAILLVLGVIGLVHLISTITSKKKWRNSAHQSNVDEEKTAQIRQRFDNLL